MTNTPGDPTQDDTVLASAYLDGEVTPDERARVEASDELLAEVERLRRIRAVIAAEVEPAAVSTRESHLAAALGVYDQLGAASPAGSAVTPMSAGRARRTRRTGTASGDRTRTVLGVAAGLVIVAGAGAVIRGVIVSSDDTDDAGPAPDVDEPAEESGIGPSEDDIITELEGGNTNDEPTLDFDPGEVAADVSRDDASETQFDPGADPAGAPADEPAEDDAPMAESAPADAADEPTAAGQADDGDPLDDPDSLPSPEDPPPEAEIVRLDTPDDLADFAAPAAYAPDPIGGVDADIEFSECGQEPPTGLGLDRLAEPAVVDDEVFSVGVDLDRGRAFVFRVDCSVVLAADLPSEDDFLAGDPAPTTTERP